MKFADFKLGKRLLCLLGIVVLIMLFAVVAFGPTLNETFKMMSNGQVILDFGHKGVFSLQPIVKFFEIFWDCLTRVISEQRSTAYADIYMRGLQITMGDLKALKTGSLLSLGFCLFLTAIFPNMRSRLCFVGALFAISFVNLLIAFQANLYLIETSIGSLPFMEQDMAAGRYDNSLAIYYYALRDSQTFGWLWVANITAIVNCMFGRTLSKIKGIGKGLYLLPLICSALALCTFVFDSVFLGLSLPYTDGVYLLLIVTFYAIFTTQILKVVELPEKTVAFKLLWHILLLLFTSGLWEWYWVFRTTKYLNKEEVLKKRITILETLLYIFVEPYRIYWLARTAWLTDKLGKENGINSKIWIVCLVLAFFVPIVPVIMIQAKLNKIVKIRTEREEEPVVEETVQETEFSENTTVEEIAQEAIQELEEEVSGLAEDVGLEVATAETPTREV